MKVSEFQQIGLVCVRAGCAVRLAENGVRGKMVGGSWVGVLVVLGAVGWGGEGHKSSYSYQYVRQEFDRIFQDDEGKPKRFLAC